MDKEKLYEGKSKIIYKSELADQVIQYYKNDVTAFNKEKFDVFQGKGTLNCNISSYLLNYLSQHQVKNHLIKQIDNTSQLVYKLDMIPIEVIIRNKTAGSLCKKYDIEKGLEISPALLEFAYKNDAAGDPTITEDIIIYKKLLSLEEIEHIKAITHKINHILTAKFKEHNLHLIDFKLEFGFLTNQPRSLENIILGDEFTPDSCRLWDNEMNSFDKDVYRNNTGDLVETYRIIAKKLNINIAN